ncbi:MAG: hypothetical protein U1C53_00495 [Candidatus Veblenbacteria bacterium]|nr:hypothetical protein [Candidatus Veblenbacteria bacterium]
MAEIFELPPSKKPDEPIISQHTAEAIRAIYGILHDSPDKLLPFYIETTEKSENLVAETCQQFKIDKVMLDHVLAGGGGGLTAEELEKISALQEQIPEQTLIALRTLYSEIRQLENYRPSIFSDAQAYQERLKQQKDSG